MKKKKSNSIKMSSGIACMMLAIIFFSTVAFAGEKEDEISELRKYLGETVYDVSSNGYLWREKMTKIILIMDGKIGGFYINGFIRGQKMQIAQSY